MYQKKGEVWLFIVLALFLILFGFLLKVQREGGITGAVISILPAGEAPEEENLSLNTSVENTSLDTPVPNETGAVNLSTEKGELIEENAPDLNFNIGNPSPTATLQDTVIQGDASATSCGTVTASLTLTSDVSSGGSCFNISANKIAIDCAGRRITYGSAGTGGFGINNSEGYDNLIIKNCEIIEGSATGDSQFAVYMPNSINTTIENNTINTSGTSSYALYIPGSNTTTIHANKITTTGANGWGIALVSSNNTGALYNNITTNGSQGYALYLTNSSGNNTFTTNSFSSGTAFEILDESGDNILNYLAYNNTEGDIRWFDNGTGSFVRNLTLNGSISLGTNLFIDYYVLALNTSAFSPLRINYSGNMTLYGLMYILNPNIMGTSEYITTINDVRASSSICSSTTCPRASYNNGNGRLNFNTSTFGSFTTNGTWRCPEFVSRNIRLGQNISPGTCVYQNPTFDISTIAINSRSLTVDCAGFSIQGNITGDAGDPDGDGLRNVGIGMTRTGDGLVITDFTIKNCNVFGFETCIELRSNSTALNNIVHNCTTGIGTISLIDGTAGKIINNTAYDSGTGVTGGNSNFNISNNTARFNLVGFAVTGNIVEGNNISSNYRGGSISSNNCTRHNLFYNNTIGVLASGGLCNGDILMNNTYAMLLNSTVNGLSAQKYRDIRFENNGYDINIIQVNTGSNITLINSSINESKVHVGATAKVIVRWYVDVNITDSSGAGINGANVTAYNSLEEVEQFNRTNSNGLVRMEVQEKYISDDITYYVTPGTIKASTNNYTSNSTTINLKNKTSSTMTYVNLTLVPVTCNSTIYSDFDFGNSYNCAGDGIIVGADRININGNGFTLNGSNTGVGILVNGYNHINITNLHISNFTTAVYFFNSNNSYLQTDVINNSVVGIVFNNSHNNSIYDTILNPASEYRVLSAGARTVNNSLINVSMDVFNISASGNSSIFYKWYVEVNTTFNNLQPLTGGNVTGFFNSTQIRDNVVTSSNGKAIISLTERIINSSGSTFMTPHNISLKFTFLGVDSVNSTVVNLSINNNTLANLSLILNCTAPSDGTRNTINQTTTFCPGTYEPYYIRINASNIALNCVNTILKPSASFVLLLENRQNVNISGCLISSSSEGRGIRVDNSSNLFLINLSFSGTSIDISCTYSNNTYIKNLTSSSSGLGLGLTACNYFNVTRSLFQGSTGISIHNSNHNRIHNNSFSGPSNAIVFRSLDTALNPSYNNTFYHNSFASISTYYFKYYSNAANNNSFNTTTGSFIQGNEYDDYCDHGSDLDGDGYADNFTSSTSRDWPYNQNMSTKILAEGANFTDYGPRITTCPPSSVQLGSSGGQVRGPAAAGGGTSPPPAEPAGAPPPRPPPPPPPEETYSSAAEAAQFLEKQVTTQDLAEKVIRVKVVLENTGTKKMLLFPEIFQQSEDPFYIVTRKTLGYEGSLFAKMSSLSYSPDPVAGRLLKATIINPEQVILNPGEKIEKIIEIEEGLVTPRQLKIQFTTLGDTVFEQEIQVQKKAFSGTAVDIDKENQFLDVYAVFVPEELTEELEEYYAASPSGALAAEKMPSNEGKSFQNLLKERRETKEPEEPKQAVVGFAQQVMEQFRPPSYRPDQYQLEFSLSEPGSSEAYFSDLYGPYDLKQNQTFIFAQQLRYNPEIYAGNYDLRTKIYRGGNLLVENKFDLSLGEEKRGLAWLWITGQIVIIALGALAYLHVKKQHHRLRKAME